MECYDENFGEGSSFQAAVTLLRYPLGIAFFLLPWAMKFGGIVAGPIFIAVFIILNAYRSYVLSKVASELSASGVPSPSGYSDWWILENSLGKVRRTSVNCYLVIFSTLQWLALLGHASTFFAFAGLNLNQAFPSSQWPGITGDRIYIGICVGIVVLVHAITQWLRNISQESTCMCVILCSSSLLIFLPVLVTVFYAFPTIVSFAAKLVQNQEPLHPSIAADWTNIGLLLAGLVFVIGATPDDVSATFGTLRNRPNFPIILLSVAAIVLILGAGFSIAVFLGLDGATCGSVTFNLPLKGGQYLAVRVLTSICALIFVSFRHQIEPKLSNRLSAAEIVCDIVFKIIFLGIAGGLAIGLPTYSGIACLFGSLTSFTLTLTFPFLCDVMLHTTGGRTPGNEKEETDEGTSLMGSEREEKPLSVARIVRDVIFIAIGIAGMIGGLYTTILSLESELARKNSFVEPCAWTETNTTTLA